MPDQTTVGGTYTLLISVDEPIEITIGALGTHDFQAGAYAYTGSALGTGGFSRVDRHQRLACGDHDAQHWHIDHLLRHQRTQIDRVVKSVGAAVECAVANRLPPGPIGGFGASDCRCRTHLTERASLSRLTQQVTAAHEAALERYENEATTLLVEDDRSQRDAEP